MSQQSNNIARAVAVIKSGGVIAYPTEAVFGLGCDPFNRAAVDRLLHLKHRPLQQQKQKGLILIAADWLTVSHLIEPIEPALLARAQATWPGPFTWVFPAKSTVPEILCGPSHTIALRITAHPIARTLCTLLDAPLVSTSANFSHHPPLRDAKNVLHVFGNTLDYVLPGQVDPLARPTKVFDALTGKVLRA